MYIWLMRHGATELSKGADAEYRLSARGVADVKAMAAIIRSYTGKNDIAVYSSLITRAVQTAEIMAAQLGVHEVRRHETLIDGDISGFYEHVLRQTAEKTVLCVGHSPYLEEWLRYWTGAEIDFSHAAAAFVDYKQGGDSVGTGQLLLYVQPAVLPLLRQQTERRDLE